MEVGRQGAWSTARADGADRCAPRHEGVHRGSVRAGGGASRRTTTSTRRCRSPTTPATDLQAAIFTNELDVALRAARTLDFGGVLVNEVPTWRTDQMPYGGLRDSGNTREGPAYAVREMTEERLIVIQADVIDPDQPPRWWTVDEANAALASHRRASSNRPRRQPRSWPTAPRRSRARRGATATPRPVTRRRSSTTPWRSSKPKESCCATSGKALVDFPAAGAERARLLAVLVGRRARRSRWWHWPEDGFAGRTPLSAPPA